MIRILISLVTLSACVTPPLPQDAGFTPTQTRLLGLNDITLLLPLESLDASTAFPPAVEIIPFSSFDRLTSASPPV